MDPTHALVGVATLLLSAPRPGPLDATLTGTHQEARALSSYRGKAAVLFYEDKDSTHQNEDLKRLLFSRAKERHLLDAAWVVPVANLADYNWFPARQFAAAAVRGEETKAGVPILIDWTGTLTKAPWSLPAKMSSVLLLDASGQVIFERSGSLSPAEIEQVFALLEIQLQRSVARDVSGAP